MTTNIQREIPSLYITLLKTIAKQPSQYLNDATVEKAILNNHKVMKYITEKENGLNISQAIIDYVTDAGRFTDDAIPVSLFSNSETIIVKNSKISGKYLQKLVDKCSKSIINLDISGCFQVDDNTLMNIIPKCPLLKKLNIRNCRKLSDKSIDFLITQNKIQLEYLNIGGNFNISNLGLQNFLNNYKNFISLHTFELSGLPIDDTILNLISTKCISIVNIGIGYSDISEDVFAKFIDKVGHRLSKLNISWLSQISMPINFQMNGNFIIDLLSSKCPVLRELDISGIKTLNISNITHLLDTKIQQSLQFPGEWLPVQVLHAKFISTTKAQVEATIATNNYNLILNA